MGIFKKKVFYLLNYSAAILLDSNVKTKQIKYWISRWQLLKNILIKVAQSTRNRFYVLKIVTGKASSLLPYPSESVNTVVGGSVLAKQMPANCLPSHKWLIYQFNRAVNQEKCSSSLNSELQANNRQQALMPNWK